MTTQPAKKQRKYKVITLVSRKGGTGKSSSIVNIAQSLRICSKRVAIIDADDQQSIRSWEAEVQINKRDVKYGDFFPDVISEGYTAGVITNIFDAFDNDPEWADAYDYVLIDMAGHMNQIREGGLTTELYDAVLQNSDMVIMVNNPDMFCVKSNAVGCEVIEERIEILGLGDQIILRSLLNNLPTKENSGVRKAIQDFRALEQSGKMWPFFNTMIQHSRRVGASITEGCTSFIPIREKIADSYYEVMNEIIDQLGKPQNLKSLSQRKQAINKLVRQSNFVK